MLNQKSKNLIKEEMLNLPKEIQEAINISNWENISEEIGKKYLLTEDEIETLQLETASFLLQLINEDDYLTNIEKEILNKNTIDKYIEEMSEKIFMPIQKLIEENIKKNLQNKKINIEQNLDFILSGGDYRAFLNYPSVEENNENIINNNI